MIFVKWFFWSFCFLTDAASVRRKFGGGKKQMRVELDTLPLIPLPGRSGEEKESASIPPSSDFGATSRVICG
jgi:hypothetical protein